MIKMKLIIEERIYDNYFYLIRGIMGYAENTATDLMLIDDCLIYISEIQIDLGLRLYSMIAKEIFPLSKEIQFVISFDPINYKIYFLNKKKYNEFIKNKLYPHRVLIILRGSETIEINRIGTMEILSLDYARALMSKVNISSNEILPNSYLKINNAGQMIFKEIDFQKLISQENNKQKTGIHS